MRLNWFSPLPPARTDIAHYTARVLPALTSLAEVTLWTDQQDGDQNLTQEVEVRSYRLDRMPWVELNRADATFYQIGNNPVFHSTIWQISRLHAGIVVLHDLRLHHFFDDIFRVQRRDLSSYLAVMGHYYGEQGMRDATECFYGQARNIGYMAEQYPLTRFAVEDQLGIVAHTQEAYDALSSDQNCPVVLAPLPFAPRNETVPTKQAGPPYRLIVFGYIGRNRRLVPIFRALAQLPERNQFKLDVYGDILDEEDQLRAEIRSLDLKEQVRLRGFATEARLDEALSQAHLAINLRYPTMGEASGSQLRIWAHRLPALVSRADWYATLPADTVGFVRTDENEIADIQLRLREFLTDPRLFAAMGERGYQLLKDKHAPLIYSERIVEFARYCQGLRPRVAANRLAERTGALLGEWLSLHGVGNADRDVAARIYEFGAS